jgi:hypothetical protein
MNKDSKNRRGQCVLRELRHVKCKLELVPIVLGEVVNLDPQAVGERGDVS